jgi:hypothetical protein
MAARFPVDGELHKAARGKVNPAPSGWRDCNARLRLKSGRDYVHPSAITASLK